jgi:hypothetical protein
MSLFKLDHDQKETLRTIDSFVSILFQVVMLGVQVYGLHYIMTHSH